MKKKATRKQIKKAVIHFSSLTTLPVSVVNKSFIKQLRSRKFVKTILDHKDLLWSMLHRKVLLNKVDRLFK